MKNRIIVLLTLLGVVISGLNVKDKAVSEDSSFDGTQRNMVVYAPADLPENAPRLISLHGMNQDAPYQQNRVKWESGMAEK